MVDHIVELVEKRAAEIEAEQRGAEGGGGARVQRARAGLTRGRRDCALAPFAARRRQRTDSNEESGMLRIALVIGLLGAVGPFAIDMYLPALPEVAADLGASAQATQFTLTAFFVAFGVSQLAYGPLSDQFGRKPPLYVGLAIFLLGTLGCALAPTIGTLIAARLVQGLGAATVMVVPRAIIRDLHSGPEATRLMAMVLTLIPSWSRPPLTIKLLNREVETGLAVFRLSRALRWLETRRRRNV